MKKIVIALAAIALIAASCSQQTLIDTELPSTRTVRVSATLPTDPGTRTVFYDGTWDNTSGYGFKVKWAVGDRFSILCWQGDDANWGNLISEKDEWGDEVITEKGEIIYTLTAGDISSDGRTVNFTFNIPAQITDNTQPVKVLLTYLGCNWYFHSPADYEPPYANKPFLKLDYPEINETTKIGLKYISERMPMILRGEIAAGWLHATGQAVFEGRFRHQAAIMAVQIRNNTPSTINPRIFGMGFKGGKLLNTIKKCWNPIFPDESYVEAGGATTNTSTAFLKDESNRSIRQIPPGESFVCFIPLFFRETPTSLRLSYLDWEGGSSNLYTTFKANASSITFEAGKCYTVRAVYNGPSNLVWDTTPAIQAPWE